jgi:hypothetical protein
MNYKRIMGPWYPERNDQAQALADALQFATTPGDLEGLNAEPLAAFVQLLIYKAVDIMDNAGHDHGAEYWAAPVEVKEVGHAAYNMGPVAIYTEDAQRIRDDLGAFEALRLALICHYDMLGYYPGTDDPSNWRDLMEFIEGSGRLVDTLAYFFGDGILYRARDIAAAAEGTNDDEPSNRAVRAALDSILDSVQTRKSAGLFEIWGL